MISFIIIPIQNLMFTGDKFRKKINVVTNYFALNHSEDWKLHLYDVQYRYVARLIQIILRYLILLPDKYFCWSLLNIMFFSPEVDVKRERNAIMRHHLQKNFEAHVFDGQNIFSATYIGKVCATKVLIRFI